MDLGGLFINFFTEFVMTLSDLPLTSSAKIMPFRAPTRSLGSYRMSQWPVALADPQTNAKACQAEWERAVQEESKWLFLPPGSISGMLGHPSFTTLQFPWEVYHDVLDSIACWTTDATTAIRCMERPMVTEEGEQSWEWHLLIIEHGEWRRQRLDQESTEDHGITHHLLTHPESLTWLLEEQTLVKSAPHVFWSTMVYNTTERPGCQSPMARLAARLEAPVLWCASLGLSPGSQGWFYAPGGSHSTHPDGTKLRLPLWETASGQVHEHTPSLGLIGHWPDDQANHNESDYHALVLGLRDHLLPFLSSAPHRRVLVPLTATHDALLTYSLVIDAVGADSVRAVVLTSPSESHDFYEIMHRLLEAYGSEVTYIPLDNLMQASMETLLSGDSSLDPSTLTMVSAWQHAAVLVSLGHNSGDRLVAGINKSRLAIQVHPLAQSLDCNPLADVWMGRVTALLEWRYSHYRPLFLGPSPDVLDGQWLDCCDPEHHYGLNGQMLASLDPLLYLFLIEHASVEEAIEAGHSAHSVEAVREALWKSVRQTGPLDQPGIAISHQRLRNLVECYWDSEDDNSEFFDDTDELDQVPD